MIELKHYCRLRNKAASVSIPLEQHLLIKEFGNGSFSAGIKSIVLSVLEELEKIVKQKKEEGIDFVTETYKSAPAIIINPDKNILRKQGRKK